MAVTPLFTIDLNADVGEALPDVPADSDGELLRWITSASIAAGFHGGNPTVLRDTVRRARSLGVAIGAHPSYPDREGFGRRQMTLPAGEVENLVLYQIAAVAGVAAAEGLRLHHVKPHGALYNAAAQDRSLADAIVRAVTAVDRSLLLYAPPGSELLRAGQEQGVQVVPEGFADRGYEADGSLTPRATPGAVITDAPSVAARAIRMVKERVVVARDGSLLPLDARTICIHSDTPGAPQMARALRAALEAAAIAVAQA